MKPEFQEDANMERSKKVSSNENGSVCALKSFSCTIHRCTRTVKLNKGIHEYEDIWWKVNALKGSASVAQYKRC